jgi:hypothetical protein
MRGEKNMPSIYVQIINSETVEITFSNSGNKISFEYGSDFFYLKDLVMRKNLTLFIMLDKITTGRKIEFTYEDLELASGLFYKILMECAVDSIETKIFGKFCKYIMEPVQL